MRRLAVALVLLVAAPAHAATRTETFDTDPGWSGSANRPSTPCITRLNGFGVTAEGAVGGAFSRSVLFSELAQPLAPARTLDDRLSAEGTLTVTESHAASGLLFGWHNRRSRNWRTNDSLMFRLDGEEPYARAFIEYGTRSWLAGGDQDAGRGREIRLVEGRPYPWRLDYDPDRGTWRKGRLRLQIAGLQLAASLPPAAREDGATFDRFGFLGQMLEGPGSGQGQMHAFVDGLRLNGRGVGPFGWLARRAGPFADCTADRRADFGYSPRTAHAGGRRGEAGGSLVAREIRRPPESAYGDRIGTLRLDRPFGAAGRVSLRRGSSGGDAYIGFYRARSIGDCDESGVPRDLVAAHVGGPSRVGFLFAPIARGAHGKREDVDDVEDHAPRIPPDGRSHRWSLTYTPPAATGEPGRLDVTLDDALVTLEVPRRLLVTGPRLNRFGLRGVDCSGHGLELYIDDVTYTSG